MRASERAVAESLRRGWSEEGVGGDPAPPREGETPPYPPGGGLGSAIPPNGSEARLHLRRGPWPRRETNESRDRLSALDRMLVNEEKRGEKRWSARTNR